MRKLQLLALSFALAFTGVAKPGSHSSGSKVHVKAYTTKKGKQVKAHDRTAPNGTHLDNWSAKGNVNPETGKKGTKNVTK